MARTTKSPAPSKTSPKPVVRSAPRKRSAPRRRKRTLKLRLGDTFWLALVLALLVGGSMLLDNFLSSERPVTAPSTDAPLVTAHGTVTKEFYNQGTSDLTAYDPQVKPHAQPLYVFRMGTVSFAVTESLWLSFPKSFDAEIQYRGTELISVVAQ